MDGVSQERRMLEVHLGAGRVWLLARSDGGDEEVGVNFLCEVVAERRDLRVRRQVFEHGITGHPTRQ